jgi:integrase
VLRQLLKAAKLWYRFREDYVALPNRKPPFGRALTEDEQQRLFALAAVTPRWLYAYTAATLAFYCGLRACEIKGLRWKDVDLLNRVLEVRRSKTPAGWRTPTLNRVCVKVLQDLWSQAARLGFTEPTHYVFPWHGRNHRIDPTRPITSWRTAWRSMLKAAGLTGVCFHHGRHTAITTLQEKGLPDWVIQAQVGHVSPAMMKTYSHIRRKALNQAAAALEPECVPPLGQDPHAEPTQITADQAVASQTTSQTELTGVARH